MTGQTYNQVEVKTVTKLTSDMEYNLEESKVLAMIMCQFNDRMTKKEKIVYGSQHIVTYSLQKGLNKFGQCGPDSTYKEMKQMNDQDCFEPIHKSSMTETEKKRVMESLIFLAEKKSGGIKARYCANGSTQRDYMSREDVSSPMVMTELTMLTSVFEAEEE